ncbi:MAG TPA: hypothetical protein VMW72_07880 [Sedimentisphaerales bacterium]|nr:hypothetical protein [Sedimentisphaerales bacterium]
MEKAEIKRIDNYFKGIAEELVESDYRAITKQSHLTRLYPIIECR